jgi:hypothetical protein
MPKCGDHNNSTGYPDCKSVKTNAPTCDKKCPGNNADYSSDKHKATSSYGKLNSK